MKLRNKKTGDIKDACEVLDMKQEDGVLYKYYSLAELNEGQKMMEEAIASAELTEPFEPPKDFRPEHLKRMGLTIEKGGEE